MRQPTLEKLIWCSAAVALGAVPMRAQGQMIREHGSVSPGPPSHATPVRRAAPIPAEAPLATGAAATGSGIVYTCDPTITALLASVCTTLNTTIAALYSNAFTNANATIYITTGNTALGASDFVGNIVSYSQFRSALIASQAGANDVTALANSAPSIDPFGSDMVGFSNGLQRALGLGAPTGGVDANNQLCHAPGTAGCYDGMITISSFQSLYFRSGTIGPNQFDFFTVVEHETDEILGTASCAFGNSCSGYFAPADLYRYHSNGTRTFGLGSNDPCSSSDSTNACFSLDGMHYPHQYNNMSGLDAGDWNTDCTMPLVQDANVCAGTAGVDISPGAEILVLDVVGFTLRNPPVGGAPYSCTNSVPPLITSIDSASGYGGYPYFASGSWLEIKGNNLADPLDPRLLTAVDPGQWGAADFTGVNAPIALDGISVSIDGKPAYVWYLSPGQLNVQAPEDTAIGDVAITVTNCKASSPAFPFPRQSLAPGMLAPPGYAAGSTQYLLATLASNQTTYILNTSTGASFGLNSRPAKPGDVIIAYGIGFGDVTPTNPPGVETGQSNSLNNPVTVSFGSTKASLTYSGLAGGFVGLYEFYITVPPGLANEDYSIIVTQNGVRLPQTFSLTVHN